jgi:uncharacterized repeat protein (TIGR03803 family)
MSMRWPSPLGLRRWGIGLLMGAAALFAAAAQVAEPEVIYPFARSEGTSAPLVPGPDGLLYGAGYPGKYGQGMVFRLAADGQLEVLHHFTSSDGAGPLGLVLASDGFFYGVTASGGAFDAGTAFRISPQGGFKLLHTFQRGVDGGWPRANLLLASDGHFYGTTLVGGSADRGTVFRMNANGHVKLLHAFGSAEGDGAYPLGRLIGGSDGLLYGTTSGGGHGFGTVYKMHRNGVVKVLHSFSFDGHDGYSPDTGVTEGPDGLFYGVADGHRENRRGLIFRVDRRGHLEVVCTFPPPVEVNGRQPHQPLTLGRDGAFYGTTSGGGAHKTGGTIFRFTTDGVLTTLYSFDGDSPVGQREANALVELGDGEFVGATYSGGEADRGSIYRLRVPPLRFKLDPH